MQNYFIRKPISILSCNMATYPNATSNNSYVASIPLQLYHIYNSFNKTILKIPFSPRIPKGVQVFDIGKY